MRRRTRTALATIAVLALTVPAGALEGSGDGPAQGPSATDGIEALPSVRDSIINVPAALALASRLERIGRLPSEPVSGSDLVALLDLAQAVRREQAFVARSAGLSWVVAGLGHYSSGDGRKAAGWMAADLTVGAATAILALVALPPAVQGRNLNYLQSSYEQIRDRWSTLRPAELIPAAVVSLTGTFLRIAVRSQAARDAAASARNALAAGSIDLGSDRGGLRW